MSSPQTPERARRRAARALGGLVLALLASVLVACGSSSGGLIPSGYANPLQSDFETVAADAQQAEGKCTKTEEALARTEQDFNALPTSVDASLRARIQQGIANLHTRALALCEQPLTQTSTTQTTPAQTTPAPPAQTTPTETTTTQTHETPPPEESDGGPGGAAAEEPTKESGGANGGTETPNGGVGAGGQEPGK